MNTRKMQLELGFETPGRGLSSRGQRHRHLAGARWWFDQMHAVVDKAFDWSAKPAPPPEQISLTLVRAE
jgi:hypothetical protein